jgi:hypothetical protein
MEASDQPVLCILKLLLCIAHRDHISLAPAARRSIAIWVSGPAAACTAARKSCATRKAGCMLYVHWYQLCCRSGQHKL